EDLLNPPPTPKRGIAILVGLIVLALAVAAVGIGSVSRDKGLERGQVDVAGQDVASGHRLSVDLDHDVPVDIRASDLATKADSVVLSTETLGIPLGSEHAPLVDGKAIVSPGFMRRLSSGDVTATIELKKGNETLAEHDFAIEGTQPWYLSALG